MDATMQTPPRRQATKKPLSSTGSKRKYTEEEKKQLLANLDLEVKDRVRQFEAYFAQVLEAFKLRHENEVTRIPRAIRNITMGEFADKYDGDVNKALQAITKAKMAASEEPIGIEDSARKRKWQPSVDGPQEAESSRAPKNARLAPREHEVAGTRHRLLKTPGARARRPPPSPKQWPDASPAKSPHHRVPSAQTFDPALPKAPAYPKSRLHQANGTASPFAVSKLSGNTFAGPSDPGGKKLTRQRSMTVLRGPSPQNDQDATIPSTELILSLRIPTRKGELLELDPLATTMQDLENLQGVSDEAKAHAKTELKELSSLMSKLGKWRI